MEGGIWSRKLLASHNLPPRRAPALQASFLFAWK